ncbi:MAG: T9SS type A sorting domain-containing protein [Bacteroidales bacterium]|nr:T9SS type A sorting domain-containing protein [Bacteroidales bacterium]
MTLTGNENRNISYSWDSENNKWDTSYFHEYKYDSTNKLIEVIVYSPTYKMDEWVPGDKLEYKYDANGLITEIISYWYDDDKEIFIGNAKHAYNYDIANNVIQFNSSKWDEEEEVWVDLYKIVYTLDNKISSNDLINPADFDEVDVFEMNRELHIEFDVDVKILDYSVYAIDEKSEEFFLWEKHTLYYSEEITVIENSNENIDNNTTIKILPNPIDEYISITINGDYNSATFELFNAQGVKIKNIEVSNSQTYSMSDIQTGLYSYKLNVDGKIKSGKLQKR